MDEKVYASQSDFNLFTGKFNETARELKKIHSTMVELKANLDGMQLALLPTWEGKGRNTYEKKYRVVLQMLTDINDDLEEMAENILDAEKAYIEADMELAKKMDGDQNRF